MTYNPDIHHRNSIRLQSYDYRAAGAYFVTICTFQKEPILADIQDDDAQLTPLGKFVQECWNKVPQHFPNVELDMFVIMPNHIHAIFMIHEPVGATHASPLHGQPGPPKRSIGAIVGSLKSACTKRINELRDTPGIPVWQRNYHERVIRNDEELHALRDYIQNNPARWEEDSEHPTRNMGMTGNAP